MNRMRCWATCWLIPLLALLVLMGALTPVSASIDPDNMPRDTLARSLFTDVMVGGDAAIAATLIDPAAEVHTEWGELTGPGGLVSYLEAARQAFPGLTFELVEIDVFGDAVTVRWRADLGDRAFDGRTLATIEDGVFTRILLMDEGHLSAIEGHGASATGGGMGVPRTYADGRACPPTCNV